MSEQIAPFAPLNRSSECAPLSDGRRILRAYSPANPHYYHSNGLLLPVDPLDIARATTASGAPMNLWGKNIVSCGVRADGTKDKLVGLRPDVNQSGAEQLEFSLGDVVVNGKFLDVNVSMFDGTVGWMKDLGGLRIANTRRGMRLMIPVDYKRLKHVDTCSISFDLNLEGLSVQTVPTDKGDEFWFFSQDSGEFRFRIATPKLIDTTTMEPIHGIHGMIHSLEQVSKGVYRYTKSVDETFREQELPDTFYFDADTCYGTSADGYVRASHASWATVRGLASGSFSSDSDGDVVAAILSSYDAGPLYRICRAFLSFDTRGIDNGNTVDSCTLHVYGVYNYKVADIYVYEWTGTSVSNDSFNDFGSTAYGSGSWASSAWISGISFNATGLAKVDKEGYTYICLREAHDAENSTPTNSYWKGVRFADYSGTTYDPYLSVVSSASNVLPPKYYHYMHH